MKADDELAFFAFLSDLQFEWVVDGMMQAYLIIGRGLAVTIPEISTAAALMIIALEEVHPS